MIRFLPDTWRDAVLRPLAMVFPDSAIYIEIKAPDLRFMLAICLMLVLLLLRRRGLAWRSPGVLLWAWCWVAFAAWLATSGNGRYFIPVLAVIGPVCVALIAALPTTKGFRALIAALVVALQGAAVWLNDSARVWELVTWTSPPFFDIAVPARDRQAAVTYVTATSLSYSLVAPYFAPDARWVNISSQPDAGQSEAGRRVQKLLAESAERRLIIPAVRKYMTSEGLPDEEVTRELNGLIAGHRIRIADPSQCRVIPSRGLAVQALGDLTAVDPKKIAQFGFWVCPLAYPVQPAPPPADTPDSTLAGKVFEAIERKCPRFFPPGQSTSWRIADGFVRSYAAADMKAYVLDDGDVLYRYWRSLNPGRIGTVKQVLADDFKMDCGAILGRSSLPWERQM